MSKFNVRGLVMFGYKWIKNVLSLAALHRTVTRHGYSIRDVNGVGGAVSLRLKKVNSGALQKRQFGYFADDRKLTPFGYSETVKADPEVLLRDALQRSGYNVYLQAIRDASKDPNIVPEEYQITVGKAVV